MPPPLKVDILVADVSALDTPALNSASRRRNRVRPLARHRPLDLERAGGGFDCSGIDNLRCDDARSSSAGSFEQAVVGDGRRVRLASPASMIEPRLVQELVGSMVSDEFVPMSMTLDAVVVKVVGSMATVSPLATSIVPLLVNVVGSIVSEAFARSAVIVPLLVRELPLN